MGLTAWWVCLLWLNPCALAAVISEIYYHPSASQGGDVEYVEIYQPGVEPVSLAGWQLVGAVDFAFPADTVLAGGEYLVVCRDGARFEKVFALRGASVLGDFTGSLANDGETVLLVNDTGAYVDAVTYDDEAPWPQSADGDGAALHRRCFRDRSDTHRNWQALGPTPLSGEADDCKSEDGSPEDGGLEVDEKLRVVMSEIFYHPPPAFAWLAPGDDGEGTEFVELANPAMEAVDLSGWRLRGVGYEFPAGSNLAAGEFLVVARDPEVFAKAFPGQLAVGGYAGRLANSGERVTLEDGDGTVVDSVLYGETDPWPYAADGEGQSLEKVVLTGDGAEAANWRAAAPSPGRPNASAAARHAPSVRFVRRFPQQPRELEEVVVTALVVGAAGLPAPRVELVHNGGAARLAPNVVQRMTDDGLSGDGDAGDGVYGVRLPPFAHDTQVRFRIFATQDGVTAESPVPQEAGAPRADEVWGFYVNDLQSQSDLPTYHILLDGVDGSRYATVNAALSCDAYSPSSFAFRGELYPDVGVRFRGNTMCYVEKRNFKIRFRRGRLFRGVRKLNLNSLWTDKSLVREHLAWDLQRELGMPYAETGFSRVHVSGSYYGLYLELEHPDDRFLERNGLSADATLYKATDPSPGELRIGVEESHLDGYQARWELETRPAVDYSDLADFVDAMHLAGTANEEGPRVDFWQERSFEDLGIAYQTGQVLLNNLDGAQKNHFLYHDLDDDRWALLPWDLDLSFGKYFAGCAVDLAVGRRVGTLNDVMLCAPVSVPEGCELPVSLDPWYASTVLAPAARNWFVDYFFRAGGGYYQRAYLKTLWDALRDKYRPDLYRTRVEALAARLADAAMEDAERWGRYPTNVPGFPADMASNVEILVEQVGCHRESLLEFLDRDHPWLADTPIVKFTEIHYLPEEGRSRHEFVELVNLSDTAVDFSGWVLAGGVTYDFPPASLVEPGEVFVVAASPEDFRLRWPLDVRVFGPFAGKLSSAGETLILRDAGPGHPATVDRVSFSSRDGWPRVVPGESIELRQVSVASDNDRSEAWDATRFGGTPGALRVPFVRGDSNRDGRLNISDALVVVDVLFRGASPLVCPDAADANDSGAVELTDVIVILNRLFLSGPPLPPPYPKLGEDPTGDDLGCVSGSRLPR